MLRVAFYQRFSRIVTIYGNLVSHVTRVKNKTFNNNKNVY